MRYINLLTYDVVILHPVIDFHGPIIAVNFHVDCFGSFHTSITYARLLTDRLTDGRTDGQRHHLKPPTTTSAGLVGLLIAVHCVAT